MNEVGIRALKQNASKVVAEAAAGRSVTITDRGRPAAVIGPIPSSPLEALIAAGRIRPAKRRLSSLPAPQHEGSLTATVLAMGAEERY